MRDRIAEPRRTPGDAACPVIVGGRIAECYRTPGKTASAVVVGGRVAERRRAPGNAASAAVVGGVVAECRRGSDGSSGVAPVTISFGSLPAETSDRQRKHGTTDKKLLHHQIPFCFRKTTVVSTLTNCPCLCFSYTVSKKFLNFDPSRPQRGVFSGKRQ